MTVVLDTSILVAFLHAGEPAHARAREVMEAVMAGEHGLPVSLDAVLDEGLTLLARRPGRLEACRSFDALFFGDDALPPVLELLPTTRELLERARGRFFSRFDQGLSFTDWLLVALAESMGAPVATLDGGFEGVVDVVP